jgi:signal transduction histidine kinase
VRCNPGLLRQLLWNLGENAVKYRRPDAPLSVEVRGRRVGGAYELRLSDNGAGMSPDEVRQAFEPFFRGEGVRDTPGTGLGLSIVKRIVDACGGTISLESALGSGSTFVITLHSAR